MCCWRIIILKLVAITTFWTFEANCLIVCDERYFFVKICEKCVHRKTQLRGAWFGKKNAVFKRIFSLTSIMNGCLSSSKSRPVQNWICQSLFFRRTQRYTELATFWGHASGESYPFGDLTHTGSSFFGKDLRDGRASIVKGLRKLLLIASVPPPFQVIDCHVTIYAEREHARWNVVPLQLWPAGWSMFCAHRVVGGSLRPKGLSSASVSGIHSVTLTDW